VEILRDDGGACGHDEEGQLCLTGFVNDSMPLIRYMIGDRARWSARSCGCGRAFPVIGALLGRTDDVIVTPEGRKVGRLDPAFKGADGIVEAQIVQTARDTVEVLVVGDAHFTDAAAAILVANLHARLSDAMHISIRRVAAIPRGRNGKFRSVVSRMS
jgi:phenylacetate-CoA ligase